jgi:hypothetical protein
MMAKIGYMDVIIIVLLITVSSTQPSSNRNLWLFDGNNNLESTSVNIIVDQDLTSGDGMSIQLNCLCPSASPLSFQQFFFTMRPPDVNSLFGEVNTWIGANLEVQIAVEIEVISSLPTPGTIPEGWNLMITLGNDDNGDITSVQFAILADDSILASENIDLTQLTQSSGSPASLSPIYAYTVNIVGFGGSQSAVFTSGSGIISYSSETQLQTDNDAPSGSVFPNGVQPATGETSNMQYSGSITLEDDSTIYTQEFGLGV